VDRSVRDSQLLAIRISLATGAFMLAGKWYAYMITGSTAILSDAAESVVHVIAVIVATYSTWLSHQPPDRSHPYGHDKVTYFSAGTEGFLIILAAAYIIYESLNRLFGTIELRNLDTGTAFVLGASLINLLLGWYLVRTGKRTRSLILIANGKHVLTDSWTSFGVVAGLGLTMFTGWLPWDPLVAIAVALNIVWSGGKLVRQSIAGLMDEGNPVYEQSIRSVLDAEASRRGLQYHALRYRSSGNIVWVEFHLLFPAGTLLEHAHQTATDIERSLTSALPIQLHVVSHLEPREEHEVDHTEDLMH
jgi:cation diffusion facilitator family transporter